VDQDRLERDEDQENILQDIIRGPEDIVDVTTEFLNNSGEGDESLNRRDGSGEVEPDGRGEGEVSEGEADEGEAEGSGGTLNVANSGEVHIHILMKPKIVLIKPLLSIYIY
jgi:hypothetical protein